MIYAPLVDDTVISFEDEPPSLAEMTRRVTSVLTHYPWLVCEDEAGAFLGYAYASGHRSRAAYRWSVEASVYVAKEARGQGVGRRLYDVLHAVLLEQGFGQAYAGITLPNAASQVLHERLGYEQIALYRSVGFKHGTWHDVLWLGRPLAGDDPQPTEPIPFPQLDPQRLRSLLA